MGNDIREVGSIASALIIAIVLGGIIAALFTIVQSGQRSAARDRDVAQSVQVADAGIQEAFVELAELAALDIDDLDPADPDLPLLTEIGESGPVRSARAGEGAFTWQAHRIGPRLWQVRSLGEFRTHTSVVESEIGVQGQFPFAIWGSDGLNIQTGSTAVAHLEDEGVPLIGSNGLIRLQNQLINDVNSGDIAAECYGDDPPSTCGDFDDVDSVTFYAGQTLELKDLGSAAYAPEENGIGGQCYNEATDTEITDGIFDGKFPGTTSYADRPFRYGETYCFESVDLKAGSSLGSVNYRIDGDKDDGPVKIFISPSGGGVGLRVAGTGSNRAYVNWEANSVTDPSLLDTSAFNLQINVAGGRSVLFQGNSMRIAAGIYAPGSACQRPSGGYFFGSLICLEVNPPGAGAEGETGGGNWEFTYDPALANIDLDGVYSIRTWSQESCGTTGHAWNGPSC